VTPFNLAQRFVGEIQEMSAVNADHPFITWAHTLCGLGGAKDEVPWCSSFLNAVCWMLRLPRSKSAAARSWLLVGTPIPLTEAQAGYDVVILKRGIGAQPGPEVIQASGHVGLFAGLDGTNVMVLGGNQGNGVSIAQFPSNRVLGVRRLEAH